MRVIQVLPDLDSGGVERGTVEFARYLTQQGHDSIVISAGGRLVEKLDSEGSRHIVFPVRNKSLLGLRHVRRLRRLILSLDADVVHVRSRWPAWMVYLAIGRLPRSVRPAIVSTFHGLYSVNFYSAVMARADAVIAISECVYHYIVKNYRSVPPEDIQVVHRGVDLQAFGLSDEKDAVWREAFFADHPLLREKPLVLMPGRLSRWKGQEEFIDLLGMMKARGVECHGLILGSAAPGKEAFEEALRKKVQENGLQSDITFLGHRQDMQHFYPLSSVVCNLSQKPEPFGRTVIEALALGIPVVAFDEGGPAESLLACQPAGLVPQGDLETFADRVTAFIANPPEINFSEDFTLQTQAAKTIAVYQRAIGDADTGQSR